MGLRLGCDIESRLGQLEFVVILTTFAANPESGRCKNCSFVCGCQSTLKVKKFYYSRCKGFGKG